MFDCSQNAQRVMSFAFKRQHGVDNMFEHARASEPAFFSDVTNQDGGNVAVLGLLHQTMRATANLHNRTRGRAEGWVGNGLDAVDDEQLRLHAVERSDNVGERWLGQQPQVVVQCVQALGA